jgi:hypothetical protein
MIFECLLRQTYNWWLSIKSTLVSCDISHVILQRSNTQADSQETSKTRVQFYSHNVVNLGEFNKEINPNGIYVILYTKTFDIKQI